MNPTVIQVTEGRALNAAGQQMKIIIVRYKVGTNGPFTWEGSPAELSAGKATLAMQQMAAALGALPLTAAS